MYIYLLRRSNGVAAGCLASSVTTREIWRYCSIELPRHDMSPLLKTALFTVVVPGSVAVLIPLLIAGDRAAAAGATRVLALLLLALGAVLYLRSAWDFASFGRGTPAITDAPRRLVTRGFYRYTRNPMYVAV
ncbi:MAG: hypothetical protein F4020_08195, partial [Gammaproteobacteria bacterium]|nr:hypothetical protein [Gammaproteobacteria bacterium]